MSLASGRSQKRLLKLYHSAPANLASAPALLLGEVVKVEALRLALFVIRDGQISHRLRVGCVFGAAGLLALRLALLFLEALIETSTLLLSLGERCTRASCHKSY